MKAVLVAFVSVFVASVLFLMFLLSVGCSGGPTGPSPLPPPSIPSVSVPPLPSPAPAPNQSELTITPSSVTMSVGQTVTFTASGGDGYNYVFSPVQPGYAFETEWVSHKEIRVRMFYRSNVSPTRVELDGYVPSVGLRSVAAIIYVK